MRYLNLSGRFIGGVVFSFSGFVKGIDPIGSQIKFTDYLSAAGVSIPENILLVAAILMSLAELLIGVSLLTGAYYRTGVKGYLGFMCFFTPLTLILAIYNPVSDCGCFGDAIHLTNWQTFYKNLILIVPGVFMFINLKRFSPENIRIRSASITIIAAVMFTLFMIYNIRFNPVIDFRPFKVGTNIPESMKIPAGAPRQVYDITFLYEKDGVVKEFTLDNYPANDTAWRFIDQKSVLISKGYEPPIKSFSISNYEGVDVTSSITENQGYTLLMISHTLSKAKKGAIANGLIIGSEVQAKNINFYVVTGSSRDEIDSFRNGLIFCTADLTLLKTIVRTNPGYLLIKNGTIIAKWSYNEVPPSSWFSSNLADEILISSNKRRAFVVIGLFVGMSLLFFSLAKYYILKKDKL